MERAARWWPAARILIAVKSADDELDRLTAAAAAAAQPSFRISPGTEGASFTLG